ncbi:MAG: alpha/beta hydrolase [Pseudomonadota bacterium]
MARAELTERSVTFESRGATLAGTLVLPDQSPPVAAVVFVHGSGKQPRSIAVARRFAQDGIAALVYDKRGVGESGGHFEGKQPVSEVNLDLLAADAQAAVLALTRETALKGVPIGLTGISQAGWIVPLAAQRADVDFLVLWSGPVCKISEEDIYSKYTRNADRDRAPPYAEALAARQAPYQWPAFLGRDTDAAEDLRALDVPGLWVFGADDGSVPVDLSIHKLQALQSSGYKYDYVLFSGIGHNNMRQTFATVTDWIKRKASHDGRTSD